MSRPEAWPNHRCEHRQPWVDESTGRAYCSKCMAEMPIATADSERPSTAADKAKLGAIDTDEIERFARLLGQDPSGGEH